MLCVTLYKASFAKRLAELYHKLQQDDMKLQGQQQHVTEQ